MLFLQGGNDEDPTGDAILAADRYIPEEAESDESSPSKLLLWSYDLPHRTWGGRSHANQSDDYDERQIEKAEAIALAYIPAFLRWHVFGEPDHRILLPPPRVSMRMQRPSRILSHRPTFGPISSRNTKTSGSDQSSFLV